MMARKVHPVGLYIAIYVALLILLGATIALSYVPMGKYPNNIVAIGIAITKTFLIVLIFMHLKYEKWITWFFAAAGFAWLCIMLTLTMTDYLSRNHPASSSPKGEPVFLSQR